MLIKQNIQMLTFTPMLILRQSVITLQDGTTPLYIASQEGHTSVVSLLLDKRAAVDLPDKVRMISQVKLKPYC